MSLDQLLEKIPRGSPDEGLAREVNFDALPSHIAIIMDGNGRWAAQRHLPRVEGHRAGIESVRDVVETSARLGIRALTLYAFSVENWKRPVTEVNALMTLLKRYLRLELDAINRNNIRFKVIGRTDELSRDVLQELDAGQEATARNTGMLFNIALNYGGRAEIVDAARRAIEAGVRPADLDEQKFSEFLYTAGQPDPGSADPHERRNARQQFSAVADRVRGDLGHRHALAGFPPPPPARSRARVSEERSTLRRLKPAPVAVTLVASQNIMRVSSAARCCSSPSSPRSGSFRPICLLGIAVVVALLAFREYVDIAARAGVTVSRPAGAMPTRLRASRSGCPDLPVEAALAGTTLGLSALALGNAMSNGPARDETGGALQTAAISAFAPLYIGVPLGLLSATRWTLGREAALLLILTVAVSDTFQYYSGRMFGRHLLAPVVSPKKTVEGAVGGFAGAALSLAVIGHWWLPQMGLPARIVLGLAVAAVGIVGDLFESLLKRSVGMKDASAVIPGTAACWIASTR